MKILVVFLGVAVLCVAANVAGRINICEEDREDGSFVDVCCEGWTGLEEGCLTPVCKTECVEHGGTCVAPTVCINCPEGRFGDNCENTECQQEQEDHRLLSWLERRQRHKPTCLPDGSYTILQCSRVTDMCHCVNRWTGEPYVNTYTYGVPDCSKYYINEEPMFSPKEVLPIQPSSDDEELPPVDNILTELMPIESATPCFTAYDKWSNTAFTMKFFKTKPVCTPDGFFVNKRCDFMLGYCVCVDSNTGIDIEGSKIFSTTLVCTGVAVPEPEPETDPEPAVVMSGCTVEGTKYAQDQSFYRDCNVCICHGYDVIECTARTCNQDACHLGVSDKVVEHTMNGECHRCLCDHGVFACSVVDCNQLIDPVEVQDVQLCDSNKPPNTNFYDECNSCGCIGVSALCTQMSCEGGFTDPSTDCYVNSVYLQDGQEYARGCDTVLCVEGQLEMVQSCAEILTDLVLTEDRIEVACEYKGETFYNGESLLLGSSLCKCEFFEWDCKPMIM